MNIILTENSLKFLMGNVINEAVGVPNNIYQTAVFIYDEIITQLKTLNSESFTKESENDHFFYQKNLEINKKLTIGKQNFFKVLISLKLFPIKNTNTIEMFNAAFGFKSYYDDNLNNIVSKKDGTIILQMKFVIPITQNLGDIIKYFIIEENDVIGVLTHELKHGYDHRIKNTNDPKHQVNYNTYSDSNFEVFPMNEFLHYLYYMTNIENLVRASEVYSQIKHLKITQKEFKNFLRDNKTFITLNKIKNWSYSEMKKNLLSHINEIDEILESLDVLPEILNGTPEQKVEEYCKICYFTLVHEKAQNMVNTITTNPLEVILGFSTDKKKMVNDFFRQISRFKNNFNGFYEYEEKNFKFVADKMIKKISKLYSLIDDENMKNEQISILDWELNHKLNQTKKVTYQNEIKNSFDITKVNITKKKGQK